jgi:shikimate dehydrogenase
MKACVIGYPIHHSKSPIIHDYWLKQHGIEGSYKAVEINPDNFQEGVQTLIDEGYDGFNVTVPFKEEIFKLCNEVTEIAQQIGAVNTVIIKDGKLFGTNTDAFGFIQNIKQQAKFDFQNKKALVIGAGGASRAILYGLIEAGIKEIYLTNRTKEKAENLQQLNTQKIFVVDWDDKENVLGGVDLVVNTTSLGMMGQRSLELNLSDLNPNALVTDIVYTPLMTPLLEQAQQQGNDIVTGIGMLLHQARPAFEAWTSILPQVDDTLESLVLS